jgi:hypothetical protein
MLIEFWERLRGYDKWIEAEATIESSQVGSLDFRTEVVSISKDLLKWVDREGQPHWGSFEALESSPLFQSVEGSKILIRYDPANPNRYYLRELAWVSKMGQSGGPASDNGATHNS